MNRTLARILQVAVLLFGLAALAFLLVEPNLEGRNTHATLWQVYFNDPFLAFVYLGSIALFAAVYRIFRLLGDIASNGVIPNSAPRSFRFVRNCALVLIGFVAVCEVVIFLQESDDRAGGVAMGLMIGLGCVTVALTAAKFERSLAQSGQPPGAI